MSANRPDASQVVRVHSQQTTRKSVTMANARKEKSEKAKGKEREKGESRSIFKPVLSNPFEIQWPIVPLEVQQAILDRSMHFLKDFGAFRSLTEERFAPIKHFIKRHPFSDTSVVEAKHTSGLPAIENYPYHSAIVVGINAVTKVLEGHVSALFSGEIQPEAKNKLDEYDISRRPWCVLVCRQDVSPPLLVQHLLHLVASLNTNIGPKQPERFCKIVSLPKGSEEKLAKTLNVRKAAVVLLRANSLLSDASVEKDEILAPLIASVPTVVAPYLVGTPSLRPLLQNTSMRPTDNSTSKRQHVEPVTIPKPLVPTHVKHLRTTAPKDMRAAKLARSKARAAARAKRKERGIKEKTKVKEGNDRIRRELLSIVD